MNQTEHYGLSQWALSDRVEMKDFNADNAKIDAALGKKLEVVELLNVTRTLEGVPQWGVPVDGVSLGSCFAFFLEYHFPPGTDSSYYLAVDGSGLSSFCTLGHFTAGVYGFPMRNPDACVNLRPAGGAVASNHSNDNTYRQLKAFKLKATGTKTLTGDFSLRLYVIP